MKEEEEEEDVRTCCHCCSAPLSHSWRQSGRGGHQLTSYKKAAPRIPEHLSLPPPHQLAPDVSHPGVYNSVRWFLEVELVGEVELIWTK